MDLGSFTCANQKHEKRMKRGSKVIKVRVSSKTFSQLAA